ncbi:MAG: 4-alpha-glucanotransferase [Armatimonadota bacterium]|nr:4-alpha-glucanotransferase [Armatimonadota bacterium]MDR5697785.1 4-alpha-glucanotransferase [Armatimonadota bacterium]
MSRPHAARARQRRTLRALAGRYGVQVAYRDLTGRVRAASEESLMAVLRALGAPLDSASDAPEALQEHRDVQPTFGPVAVAWEGKLVLVAPAGVRCERLDCVVHHEGGETRSYRLSGVGSVGGRRFVVPDRLPPGYHRVDIEADSGRATSLVISAPSRVPDPGGRVWGLFAPLYALRSVEDWGIGGYTELSRLGRQVTGRGGAAVGTLPLLPCFLDDPFEPSPYMPVSRLCWNEAYVDPVRAAAMVGIDVPSSPDLRAQQESVRAAALVDYRRVGALKRRVLGEIAAHICDRPRQRAVLERFLASHPHVADYARFRTACERWRRPWRAWSGAARADADVSDGTFRYYACAQWMADAQLREAAGTGVRLYMDLPLGVHPDGYDAWRYRRAFAEGVSVGAPPDPLAPQGQDWGFAPPHPFAVREDGYAYLRACLRHHFQVARMLRVDHVMGLHRLFWIPRGMPPSEGVYVRYPAEELYAVLALEAHRSGAVLVGEDLGTLLSSVRSAMRRRGLWRMYVLPFEIDAQRGVRPPPQMCVASLDTHDTPTFAAFWAGADIVERRRLGLIDEAQAERARSERSAVRRALQRTLREEGYLRGGDARAVLAACLSYLAASAARCVLVSLEDLWLETEPQNVPGTRDEYPNWRRRLRCDLDEAMGMAQVHEALELLARARSHTEG